MSKPTVGFIGLGLMGSAMCGRLLDQGYGLNIMVNRSRTNADALIERGAVERSSARDVAAHSDIVMLCVDTSASVEGRMYGDHGVLDGANPGTIVIDFGTSLPSSTKKIGADCAAKGVSYLDSPIGRTPAHAVDGLLNLMCSGDKTAFDQVKPVLDDLGENVFHLGALGSGHAVKLINNFYAQSAANAMAEAFVMADKLGIAREAVYDVMRAGPGGSVMMDLVKAFAVDNNPNALAFSVKNACKDLGYYDEMAKDAGADSVMVKSALVALQKSVDAGRGETMVSEQVDFFADLYKS